MADLAEPTDRLALPAATLTNTHWFAVDELGHVAMFDSGSAGSVPEVARTQWPAQGEIGELLVPWLGDASPEQLSYEAADVFASPLLPRFGRGELVDSPPSYEQSLFGVLLQLHERSPARERLAALGLHVLPSRDGRYAWGNLESPTLRELWREGWIVRASLGHVIEPSRMAMFSFAYAGDGYSGVEPDEYEREHWHAPTVPLRVHGLPTSLRSRLAAVLLPGVDFRASEWIETRGAVSGRQSG